MFQIYQKLTVNWDGKHEEVTITDIGEWGMIQISKKNGGDIKVISEAHLSVIIV